MRRLSEYGLFFKEFVTHQHTTGAVLPSGRFLGRALARYVADGAEREGGAGGGGGAERAGEARRLLEVGPGTGAVTTRIIDAMRDDDCLDLVELNESFVEGLRYRFANEPHFQAVAARARVLHQPVEELDPNDKYDLIVSGLPLNNFDETLVEQILATLTSILKPGGTLSFFEYIAIRAARTLVSRRAERERLRGIGRAMGAVLEKHEIRCDWIWPNVPPAWVHHVRI